MTPLPGPDGPVPDFNIDPPTTPPIRDYAELDADLKARNVRIEIEPVAEAPDLGRQQSAVLEANGYNAIRAQIMAHVNGLAEVPGEAIDACEAFTSRALAAAKIDHRPEARAAVEAMESELNIYAVVHRLRRDLIDLEQRAQARDRILAR